MGGGGWHVRAGAADLQVLCPHTLYHTASDERMHYLLAAACIAYNARDPVHTRGRGRRHLVAATEPITINVDSEAARIFKSASPEERRKLELKITLQLLGTGQHQQSLEELAREVSRKAQERGLTPEILQDILDGE